jgi:DNA-binding response OmpR family regulator
MSMNSASDRPDADWRPGDRGPGRGPRILLVEDDEDIAGVLRLILEESGYAVVVSRSLAEGLAALALTGFDMIITDGFSSLPRDVIGNTGALLAAAGAIPVALFTAHMIEPAVARSAGFRGVIAKPFDLDVLMRQVHALLSEPTPDNGDPVPATSAVAREMEQVIGYA